MDFGSIVGALGYNLIFYIPPFLFVLTVIIFFHELGHFLVARWCGVQVEAFSIGFGREIFGFVDRKGTRWRFAWLPLGGYVKFIDDENVASVSTGAERPPAAPSDGHFHTKPLWQRALVVAAGPIANFLLAIVIFAFWYGIEGETYTLPRVDSVVAGGAAEKAGFQAGDMVVAIDGEPIESFSEMQVIVNSSADHELSFLIDRAGQRLTLKATPQRKENKDVFGNVIRQGMIGISNSTAKEAMRKRDFGPIEAVQRGVEQVWFIAGHSLSYLGKVLIGRESADQLGGPIKIAEVSGQMASVGFSYLFYVAGLVSVGIGLFNLFPIPILDGGNLMFYAIEAVRGRPLSERSQAIGFKVGLALLGMLMVFVTTKDISSSWQKFWENRQTEQGH